MSVISGRVLTGNRKPLADIAVTNGEEIVQTDHEGRFALTVDPGTHPFIVAARPDGYRLDVPGWRAPTSTEGQGVELVLHPLPRRPSPGRSIQLGHITDLHLTTSPGGLVSPAMLAWIPTLDRRVNTTQVS